MMEPKKGTKQATLNAFFSPKKLGQESDIQAVESELKSVGSKRPRTTLDSTTENEATKTPVKKKKSTKPGVMVERKTKALHKQKKPIRFISPHVLAADDDEDDEYDDEHDAFNTPEAKKARAELETGGEIVPAGALISDDAVVDEEEVVDISQDDATTKVDTLRNDANTGVVNLSTASVSGTGSEVATNNDDSRKTAKSPARHNKTTAKRQQKTNEKVPAESEPARVEPLDPIIQARVDAYKLKTEELTKTYTELLVSKEEGDVIMQDIYGARLDCDLDVTVDEVKAQQALVETWKKLQHHAHTIGKTTDAVMLSTSVEFPHEVKCLIVKGIQGRSASLSVMSGELLAAFKKDVEASDMNVTTAEKNGTDALMVDRAASLAMEMEIKMLAQRTPHGVRPAKANVFEDTSVDALWVWEVGSLEKFFGDEAQKIVKRMRKNRKRLGQQLKTLAKIVLLLHQNPIDEAKVSAEEAKIGKFGFYVASEVRKAKDREAKVQEKRTAAEEKLRLDHERQEAKMEEKRKRDREQVEKQLESVKALKKFKSFFATASAHGPGDNDAIVDLTDDSSMSKTADRAETTSAKSARMDQTLSFLVSQKDPSSSVAACGSYESIVSSLKDKRRLNTRKAARKSSFGWSSRRHRDPKFGVMKLLQFYENNRPAYYGTFSTRCRSFRGGRRPFSKYPKFDYTIDSDDEWEEEEPGESLSDDENDGDESEEDALDYNDQWLAYEDEVDYMDDAEKEVERGEVEPSSPTKHKLPSQLQKKAKAGKPAKLEPEIIGPVWCVTKCSEDHFPGCTGELLCEPVYESTLMRKAREREEELKKLEFVRQQKVESKMAPLQETKAPAQANDVQETPSATEKKVETKQSAALKKGLQPKATPKKVTSQNQPAPARATVAPASSTPSPAKGTKRIISWFKKVPECALTSQETPSDAAAAPRPKGNEIITIDE
ncbi:hypothetical protein PsorP6_007246 [Peronosclerospora sorghi]|uniref:Uncharacterized protein n=1 Tax=Peronosclerospora sorghi TaxID=230839 RepID=A0ACC0WAB2_9STRA|nr:hypothetical protein PsorP6_007246 [Peronosclerospora sorghi]